jgi:hypothetical protein
MGLALGFTASHLSLNRKDLASGFLAHGKAQDDQQSLDNTVKSIDIKRNRESSASSTREITVIAEDGGAASKARLDGSDAKTVESSSNSTIKPVRELTANRISGSSFGGDGRFKPSGRRSAQSMPKRVANVVVVDTESAAATPDAFDAAIKLVQDVRAFIIV